MSAEETIAACEKIFARNLGGHNLMSNARHLRGSAWLNFNRVLCERWSHKNIVLLGDAAATAHFSVGSGSKLALESAIALADYLHSEPTMTHAFRRYEDERRLEVLRLQSAARNSTEWFEDVERYLRSRSGPVQLFAADTFAAHQPRKPARSAMKIGLAARSAGSSARRPGGSRRCRGRRCSCRSACAASN